MKSIIENHNDYIWNHTNINQISSYLKVDITKSRLLGDLFFLGFRVTCFGSVVAKERGCYWLYECVNKLITS